MRITGADIRYDDINEISMHPTCKTTSAHKMANEHINSLFKQQLCIHFLE